MPRVSAHDIFGNVRDAARDELRRSSIGLAFSGLSAGLNIGFSFVAVAVVYGLTAEPHLANLLMATVYPIGFILIIIARAQLFTENTLTPVILVLTHPNRQNLRNTARLWAIVFAANILGAFIFAGALTVAGLVPPDMAEGLFSAAMGAYEGSWLNLFVRAIFGGWLIALLVWMLHVGPGEQVLGEIVLIWIVAFVIQAAHFSHSVAGAVEVVYLAHRGIISYGEWLTNFQVPVTLGNIVGGVVFVALVNYAQAVGAGQDVERAERVRRFRELREERRGADEDSESDGAEAAETDEAEKAAAEDAAASGPDTPEEADDDLAEPTPSEMTTSRDQS